MWRSKKGTESIRSSDSSRKRSSTPEKKRTPTPERKRGPTPEGKRNPTPERKRRNSDTSLSKNVNRPSSYSKTAIRRNNSAKIKEDPHIDKSKSNVKVKLKNKAQVTNELYPVKVVKTRNKRSLTDHSKIWQTIEPGYSNDESGKSKESLGSTKSRRKERSSLKIVMRRHVWNISKPAIKRHWRQLLEDNNIDIDKINIDKVDLSLINVDGLGIENKLLKRAVVWLLK
ncbi:hypothetical protein evm_011600 [Chilo suppressalis]|nr:hypothetical protein evm_011600 [Chilo suppressalis]